MDKCKIKTKVIAIAKDEAAYLPLWVFHHLEFGFDEVEILLNRTSDNSVEILKKISKVYHQVKYSSYDWIDFLSKDISDNLQTIAYAHAYDRSKLNGFTHILFIDIDEFWVPLDFNKKIRDFIFEKGENSSISFQWACELGYKSQFLDIQKSAKYVLQPQVKTLIFTGFGIEKIRIHLPVFSPNASNILADGSDFLPAKGRPELCRADTVKLMDAFIVHRIYRSEKEYVATLIRGNPRDSDFKFKENRRGFFMHDKNEIYLNFDVDSYEKYINKYKNFVEDLNLKKDIAVARKYVLNRAEAAMELIGKSLSINHSLVRKIFQGVKIARVLKEFEIFNNSVLPEVTSLDVENTSKENSLRIIGASDVVNGLRAHFPEFLDKLSDQQLAKIVAAVLLQINNVVRNAKSGRVQVPSLGYFVVHQVPKTTEQTEGQTVKRVIFHSALTTAASSTFRVKLS